LREYDSIDSLMGVEIRCTLVGLTIETSGDGLKASSGPPVRQPSLLCTTRNLSSMELFR
jgi:hypothetical protein